MTRLILVFAGVAAAAACGSSTAPTVVTTTAPYSANDLVVGTGALASNGNRVTVSYAGWLHDSSRTEAKGTQFDASASFAFTLGTGSVIQGWERGVPGMRSAASAGSCFRRTSPTAAMGAAPFRRTRRWCSTSRC